MAIICLLLTLYLLVIFARIILSWFPMGYDSPLLPVMRVLTGLTDPVLLPLRRNLPPVQLGGLALDLSPIIVIIGIQVLASILC